MNRDEARTRLLAFLDTIRHPEVRLDAIDESKSLVAAGLIDSLALLEIVTFLERFLHRSGRSRSRPDPAVEQFQASST